MSLVETEELQRRIGALEAENARLRELAIDDNTELERAEAALADSEQRYRTLFESMDEGFCIIEFLDGPHGPLSDYVHIEANPAYAQHAGIPNVLGQKLREMVPDEADGWAELYGGVLRTGVPIRFERELVATGRHLELAAFRIEPASRRQVAVLFQDITARKRAEAAIQNLNETLELRIAEAIAERKQAEEALRQSQKMEAVGQLTGGIAHDFNNLLTAIIGNLDLALRRIDGEERVRGWLANSRKAAERAATLVQRLLAFSRQHPLEVKSVDINRLVQGMSDLLGRTIGETVTIETVLAGGLWKAAIDPNQLENTILNLVVNARDAMPDGGRLTIETANCHLDEHYIGQTGAEIGPGQYVMVAVSDSGSGMSREVMNRAFEPFFTTKPPGVGTGLGLSQAYGFAKQSGGHIRIYSEIGEGTTIKLYFPRLTGQSDIPAWSAREPAPQVANLDGSETVLVVEDDVQVNRLAVEALEQRGYRVLSAPDGPAALRLIDGAPHIDFLLTDVVLPAGMNGRELSEEVRRRRPGIKVLYVTGYTRNAIIHHGRLDPDIDLLTKPFTAEALTRKIRSILDAGTPRAAAPAES